MRVMVALEDRFFRTRNGNVYSNTVSVYDLWRRYLQVFDEVVVLARVRELNQEEIDKPRADGPSVSFYGLPYYVGPWQFLRQYRKLRASAKRAVEKADAFILRAPGVVSSLVWRQLMRFRIPYGIEVVADPRQALASAVPKSIASRAARFHLTRTLEKQCRNAAAASYVTENYLQKLYPPGGWCIHCSDVELPREAIIGEEGLRQRTARLSNVDEGVRPLTICHAGTMNALYKGQDVLIESVARCKARGLEIHLALLDDGQYRRYFEDRAKELGIAQQVRFLGRLPPGEAVREQLDSADMFVLPSLTEGLPRVLIEAMARGLPCIGSNVGGIPELLDARDMVAPGDARLLAEKIELLLTDFSDLKRMAERNLQVARRYCTDELNNRRIEFYKKVVEQTAYRHGRQRACTR